MVEDVEEVRSRLKRKPLPEQIICDGGKIGKFSGERGRNRTYNLLIKSQLLCQLSYAP